MLAKCYSGAINGVDARMVEIEVYSQLGTSQFAIVGLPDTAVKEAKDRIPQALKSQGLSLKKEYDVTVNLAPADVRKEGSIYDLPIAVGLLGASGKIRNRHLDEYGFIGELALSGEVHPDFMKVGGLRRAGNPVNEHVRIVVLYGCVSFGEIPYRAKTTLKVYSGSRDGTKAYSYEISSIEILRGNAAPIARPNDRFSMPTRILLNGVLTVNGVPLASSAEMIQE